MTRETDQYSEWDAAYLLGALSPDERWEYERHLADCPACSRGLAELSGLPALLALVPADQVAPPETLRENVAALENAAPETAAAAEAHSDAAHSPAQSSWTRLQEAARRQRRRTRRLVASSLLGAAAVLVTLALVLPGLLAPAEQSPPSAQVAVSLTQVQPSALSAEVRLVPEPWGTRLEATCIYADSGANSNSGGRYGTGQQSYALYVTDRAGVSTPVATWGASPGSTVEPVGTTKVAQKDIARVDIRSLATGQVLLDSQLAQ